jgi:hypothetical protein
MSHKMFNFKAGIDFLFPAHSCHIVFVLEMCWSLGGVLSPHTTYDYDNFKIFISIHEIGASKNQFQNGSDFSQGIDSVKLMSGVRKSFFF